MRTSNSTAAPSEMLAGSPRSTCMVEGSPGRGPSRRDKAARGSRCITLVLLTVMMQSFCRRPQRHMLQEGSIWLTRMPKPGMMCVTSMPTLLVHSLELR